MPRPGELTDRHTPECLNRDGGPCFCGYHARIMAERGAPTPVYRTRAQLLVEVERMTAERDEARAREAALVEALRLALRWVVHPREIDPALPCASDGEPEEELGLAHKALANPSAASKALLDRLAKAEAESEDARGDSEGGAMTLERLCGPAVHVCWTQDEAPEAKRELVVLVRADDLAALEARFLSAKEPSNAR